MHGTVAIRRVSAATVFRQQSGAVTGTDGMRVSRVGHRRRHSQVQPFGSQPAIGRRGPGAQHRDGVTTVILRAV